MKATTTQCSHGWHIEYLRKAETAAITTLLACEKDSHPFREAMVAGAKKALATVQSHIKEVAA